jgi:hypothetical protein
MNGGLCAVGPTKLGSTSGFSCGCPGRFCQKNRSHIIHQNRNQLDDNEWIFGSFIGLDNKI